MGCVSSTPKGGPTTFHPDDHTVIRFNQIMCILPAGRERYDFYFHGHRDVDMPMTRFMTENKFKALVLSMTRRWPLDFSVGPFGSVWSCKSLQFVTSTAPYCYKFKYGSPVDVVGVLGSVVSASQEESVELNGIGLDEQHERRPLV